MDHMKILKRAFDITWKYRALWLVGLLLVLAGGGVGSGFSGGAPGGGGGSGGGGGGGGGGGVPYPGPGRELAEAWQEIAPILIAVGIVVMAIVLLAILLGVAAVIVRYVTRVSLIQMVQSHEETGEEIGVRRGLRLGWSRPAFRFFLINLIVHLPLTLGILLLVGAVAVPIVLAALSAFKVAIVSGVLVLLLLIPVILLGVLIRVVIVPLVEIAFRACALEGLGAWEAIQSAYGLIRRNLGPTALQWLLLVGLGIAWRIALFVVNLPLVFFAFLVAGLPGAAVGGLAALLGGWQWGLALGLLIFIPAFILVIALPNMALTTFATVYYSTVWTLTYRELRVLDAGARGIVAAVDEEQDQ